MTSWISPFIQEDIQHYESKFCVDYILRPGLSNCVFQMNIKLITRRIKLATWNHSKWLLIRWNNLRGDALKGTQYHLENNCAIEWLLLWCMKLVCCIPSFSLMSLKVLVWWLSEYACAQESQKVIHLRKAKTCYRNLPSEWRTDLPIMYLQKHGTCFLGRRSSWWSLLLHRMQFSPMLSALESVSDMIPKSSTNGFGIALNSSPLSERLCIQHWRHGICQMITFSR